ncbi:MAG: hypothetical protein A2751_01805 [Candidatus Doudnabacteria bacterium RIFCSPHIGHO2_01_FULL_46_14]|uniref:ABC transporter substrate-binding protein n=1 Tax=Candidatus Doudnabacteria bacterium RIFCSPHIGHO2_01_FULL_46_14 TaxID=1817824 RepID=A0A1F5NK42_9BACT|nr:MAG: hypothetical protein A2751_01805 [Candidatus Doudnabacteria bacterium RIFCSPHIGHO2_01_FULL_46_14]
MRKTRPNLLKQISPPAVANVQGVAGGSRASKMKKTKFKILVPIIAVIFTAASCGLGPTTGGSKIELVWWKVFDDSSQVGVLVEQFEKANPGVAIKFVQKDIETYEEELLDALAAGAGPDIFSIHNDWLPKHKAKMTPASEEIFGLKDLRQNFVEVLETDLVSDSQVYALPLAVDVLALFYNKDLFASAGLALPPATWDEFVGVIPRFTRLDDQGNFQRSAVALGTADNVNRASDILSLMMLQNGTKIFSLEKGRAEFVQRVQDSQGKEYIPGARALQFYTQFADPGKDIYTWNNRSSNSIDAFASGQTAMIFSYSYLRETLAEKAPFLNYAVAKMPQIKGANLRVNYANYWAEGVSRQSENPEMAWKFLKFITDKEVLATYYEAVKQVSPRLDILDGQISDPEIGVFAENALSAKSFYKPDSDAVENIFAQMINDVSLRNVSVEDAIRAGAQKVDLLVRGR